MKCPYTKYTYKNNKGGNTTTYQYRKPKFPKYVTETITTNCDGNLHINLDISSGGGCDCCSSGPNLEIGWKCTSNEHEVSYGAIERLVYDTYSLEKFVNFYLDKNNAEDFNEQYEEEENNY